MKQIYRPYWEWEDYLLGMYDTSKKENELYLINESKILLKDINMFFNVSLNVINEWKISSDINLSNKNQNRNSWIGQAACFYNHKCPEILTRIAWGQLTDREKLEANLVAKKIIRIYETKNRKIHTGLGNQMLLQWIT